MPAVRVESHELARAEHRQVRPRRILVVVDPTTQQQPALDKAVRIAAHCGSSLELYVCDVDQDIPDSWAGGSHLKEYRELRRQRLLEELAALAKPLRVRGLAVECVCEWHAPLEQGIGHHVIRTRPDLVVKDTHGHPPLSHAVLSRTDWNLIRQVPAPLLLVHPQPWPDTVRIAAAVDPCHPADRPLALDGAILDQAHAMAGVLDGVLNVFHVLQVVPHLPGEPVPAEQQAAVHARTRQAVEQLARAGAAAPCFANGSAAEGLLGLVDVHRPDVLVMGAVSRPHSGHAVSGGTAAQILERLRCDLLVVKPPGFVSPLLVQG